MKKYLRRIPANLLLLPDYFTRFTFCNWLFDRKRIMCEESLSSLFVIDKS